MTFRQQIENEIKNEEEKRFKCYLRYNVAKEEKDNATMKKLASEFDKIKGAIEAYEKVLEMIG